MTSLLVFFHVSKVATPTDKVKTIYCQPYFSMCISVSQTARNTGIAVFAGISVFAGITVFPGLALFAFLRCRTSLLVTGDIHRRDINDTGTEHFTFVAVR